MAEVREREPAHLVKAVRWKWSHRRRCLLKQPEKETLVLAGGELAFAWVEMVAFGNDSLRFNVCGAVAIDRVGKSQRLLAWKAGLRMS